MNNKEISINKQTNKITTNYNSDHKNVVYEDPNIGEQDGTSNFPFYTPPGEDHQPRITSN